MNDSLGLVEVIGLVAAVEAADAMSKAARVHVRSVANADSGMLTVICEGDLAAVGAAVDAGKAAASRLGECIGTNVIARPGDGLGDMIANKIGSIFDEPKAQPAKADEKSAKPVQKKK